MAVNSSVFYPVGSDAKFDMDYYIKTHMPLVKKNWEPFGLVGYEVVQYSHGLDGLNLHSTKHHLSVQAFLTWHDLDGLQKALKEKGPTVFGDVPNFSNKGATFICGDVTDRWSKTTNA